jgi:hypothetical protein
MTFGGGVYFLEGLMQTLPRAGGARRGSPSQLRFAARSARCARAGGAA